MSSRKPQPKIAAAGLGGSIAVLIVFVMQQFGLDVSAEVSAALAALLSFGFGYLKA